MVRVEVIPRLGEIALLGRCSLQIRVYKYSCSRKSKSQQMRLKKPAAHLPECT